jgi:acyl-CoA thioester hydrolase
LETFFKEIQIRWADLDPNAHLRHSVYYDWGALCRIGFLYEHNITASLMQQLHFGPILFREECVFKKEIRLGDNVKIGLKLLKARKDYSRWSIQHDIIKGDDILSAILTVDGAWLDTVQRKLAIPPQQVSDVFSKMPLIENFYWLD